MKNANGHTMGDGLMKLVVLLGAAWGVVVSAVAVGAEPETEVIRVMSFNLWHGGDGGKHSLDHTLAVIKRSRADIVGLQETAGYAKRGGPRPDRAAEIAARLGWNYVDQGDRTGIISRYRIVATTPKKWGAELELPSGQRLYVFNAHLAHSPYQPYQLLGIPYGDADFLTTEREAIRAAQDARGGQVARMLEEVRSVLREGLPVFLTGDFNEPSHRDWSPAAAQANLCPLAVEWSSTKEVEAAGLRDAYRSVHPDPTQRRGLTWTPTTATDNPQDRHDRIDFVFASSPAILAAEVVGESHEFADIVVTPYPSDHRAVVAEVNLSDDRSTP
jgi:exodeoxyribonuclease III